MNKKKGGRDSCLPFIDSKQRMGRRGEIYHGRKNNQKVVADFCTANLCGIRNRFSLAFHLGHLSFIL